MKQALIRVLRNKYVVIPTSVLILYCLLGFFVAPRVIHWYAPKFVREQLQCRLDLGKVRINPFLLTFEVTDASLSSEEGLLAGFKRLYIDFEITRLGKKAATFKEIVLEEPTVHMTIHRDGSLNLEKAIPETASASPPSDAKPFRMWIDSSLIHGGSILFKDERPQQPASFTLEDIALKTADIATIPDQSGSYTLSARTPSGERLDSEGRIGLTPVHADGKITFGSLQIATFWPFIKDRLDLESAGGKLNLATDFTVSVGNDPLRLQLDNLRGGLTDVSLKLNHADKPFVVLNRLDVDRAGYNLTENRIEIGTIQVGGGAVNLIKDASGRMNVRQIIRENSSQEGPSKTEAAEHPPGSPLKIDADGIQIQDIAFNFDDFSTISPVSVAISGIGIHFKANMQAGSNQTDVSVSDFSSEIKQTRIQNPGSSRPVFKTDRIAVDGGQLDLSSRSLTVSRITLQGGSVDIRRDAKGELNWQHLFSPRRELSETPGSAESKPSNPPWNFLIQTVQVDKLEADLWDLSKITDKPVLNIESFSGRLTNVDGNSPMGFEAGFSLKQGGTVSAHGNVNPKTAAVESRLNLKSLSLTPLQPYIHSVAAVILKSADLSLNGNCNYGVKTAGAKIAYTGSVDLDNLMIFETGIQKPLIGWKRMQIPGMKLTLQPDMLNIEKIRIIHPTGEVIIGEDHTVNLTKVLKNKPVPRKSPSSPKAILLKREKPFPMRIGKVEIEKGNMIFADLSLRPQFTADIHNLKGWVSGLSSVSTAPCQIRLDGNVEPYGLAKIDGKINVFNPGMSTDMSVIFKNLEMTKLTPYSGKFAGRRITSGKLSADLKYRIQDQKLLGNNQIIVDNLTLGEHVDSPDAVNLPLDLAVAILKDSSGRIDIGLPVSGELNDPHFSFGQLIWKALTNLLTKIVTSPFRALGALLGGSDQSQITIAFDPGSSELQPPEKEKLLKLADMLKNRPQLRLGITGHYNPDTDGAAIKARTLDMAIAGQPGTPPKKHEETEAVDFTSPHVLQTLSKMFIEKNGQPAFDGLKQSIEKSTPNKADIPQATAQTLYSKLLDAEPMPPEDKLAALAHDRADHIVRELETVNGIAAARLEIKPPEPKKSDPPSAGFSLEAMAG